MTTCRGKTKEGNPCTKKIKDSESLCHLHKDQSSETNNDTIQTNPMPKPTKKVYPKIQPKPILIPRIPKLKILTEEEAINLEKAKVERAKILNVWTFNINSVRNKIDFVDKLLIKHDIDILLLTETKIQQKLESELKFHFNYNCIWNSNKNSYHHGVAFLYKKTLQIELLSNFLPSYDHEINVKTKQKRTKNTDIIEEFRSTIPDDVEKINYNEGRILTIKCTHNEKEIIIVGTYVPNSGSKRLAFRTLSWDKNIFSYLLELQNKYKDVIWLGDLNVTIRDNDLLNTNANVPGTTFEEVKNINDFLDEHQWIDTWHELNLNVTKCKNRSTWGPWSKFPLRLDYVICSPSLNDNIISSFNDQYYDGSDHIPIGTKFKFDLVNI